MRPSRRALLTALSVPCIAPRARSQEVVLRAGGTGMALAAFRLVGDHFTTHNPGSALEVLPSLGTNGGLRALQAGTIDMALLARPLRAEEEARGLRARPYARTAIAVVTSGGTTTTDITLPQIGAILRGEVTTWPDGRRLRLVRREESDADWQLLASMSPEMARSVALALRRPGLVTVGTDQENAEALQTISGSIGLMSIGQMRAERLRLRALALDGVNASMAEVEAGRYALSRTLHVAWQASPRPGVASFLDFLAGAEAGSVLEGLGYGSPS